MRTDLGKGSDSQHGGVIMSIYDRHEHGHGAKSSIETWVDTEGAYAGVACGKVPMTET